MQSVQNHAREQRRARLLRRMGRCWQLYLLLPAVVYIFIFNFMPLYGIKMAFRNYSPRKGYWGSPWVGLKYFNHFFSSPDCWSLIRNTLSLSVYSLLVGFPLPILLALMLNQCSRTGFKKVVQNAIYAPHFVSTVVLVGMINVMFSVNSGVVNTVIEKLGGQRVLFTGQADCFPHLYVWSGVWQNVGWNSVIYFAALSAVSDELHDAVIVDGASKLQRIRHIDLPTILPTITIMLVLQIGQLMNVGFEKVYLMQNNLNLAASETIQTYVYKQGLQNADYGYSTAAGLFNNVVNFVLLFSVNALTPAGSAAAVCGKGGSKMAVTRKTRSDRVFDAVNIFLLALVCLIVAYPLYFVGITSISDPNMVNKGGAILHPKGGTLLGYQELFQDKTIWSGYANTFLYTLCGTVLDVVVTTCAAYALSRRDLVGRKHLMRYFIFTMYFSGGLIPLFIQINHMGLYNTRWVLILYPFAQKFFVKGVMLGAVKG